MRTKQLLAQCLRMFVVSESRRCALDFSHQVWRRIPASRRGNLGWHAPSSIETSEPARVSRNQWLGRFRCRPRRSNQPRMCGDGSRERRQTLTNLAETMSSACLAACLFSAAQWIRIDGATDATR